MEMKQEAAKDELIRELVRVLKLNAPKCDYYDGKEFCGEIGQHVMEDCGLGREYRCTKHKGMKCICTEHAKDDKGAIEAIKILELVKKAGY